MTRLKMAVVGVGALGRHHARILSTLDRVELVAVSDQNVEIGKRSAEACGVPLVTNFRDLFEHIDAVSIAVPTFAHYAVASEFLSRGIPVLVEKPLAAKLEEAEALVELAEQHDAPLQVGHVERFNPATQAAWRLCGPPKYIRGERLSPYAFRSTDIGAVHDLMIHDIDLVLDLARSPVRDVEAFGVSILGEHEDSVQARIRFENGCIADLTANRVNPFTKRSMQIWSHRNCVSVDFGSREVQTYGPTDLMKYGESPLSRSRKAGTDIEQLKKDIFGKYLAVTQAEVAEGDALTAELDSFVTSVIEGTRPVCDGRQALEALTVADRILREVAAHQWDGSAEGAIGPFAQVSHPGTTGLRRAG